MRIVFRGFLLSLLMLSFVGCKKDLGLDLMDQSVQQLPEHIVIGESYFTQFVIRYEKNRHLTSNFRRGPSIAVNTKVTLAKISTKSMELELEGWAKPLVIKNVPKHTGDDIYQAFDKLFSKTKVNLNKFNRLERKNIKTGTVAKGMRKKAVTVAIGYPPITETMSLDVDTWVYWSGRFNRFNVNFRQGKVVSIVD